jgi:hypothetical protein
VAAPVCHPLGCHRPRIPDRIVFDKLIQVLVLGCGYRRLADATYSATTLRRRRDEWIRAGWPSGRGWPCWLPTTGCSAWTWSSWPTASRWARSPQRPTATGDGLLWATLDTLAAASTVIGRLPAEPVVHLDAL